MTHRLAIFDFDGTLADSFPWFIGVLNEVARRFHFRTVDAAEVEVLRGMDARAIIAHLGVPLWKVPMIAAHMREAQGRAIDRIRPFAGIPALLRTLDEAGVALAVASSNSEENVRRVLGGDAGRIGCFNCGASLFGKAARLRTVLKRTGIPAHQALFIGDEIRDAEAARQAGVAFGAVTWGYTSAGAMAAANPTVLFGAVEDIAAALTARG